MAVLADPAVEGSKIFRVALGMRAAAKLERDLGRYVPYLEPALAVERNPSDRHEEFFRPLLESDHRILVEGDVVGAINDQRAELTEGWESEKYKVIDYTMWCAEHAVDLDFAQLTIETALEAGIAGDDVQGEAFLWSNLADVHFAAGDIDGAIAAQKQCIELVPQLGPFRMALEYFESVKAEEF